MKTRLAIIPLCIALILMSASALRAQAFPVESISPAYIPDAPTPTQILTAKKVFISNGGDLFTPNSTGAETRRDYSQFYAAVKAWGRYDLVGSPAEADLVLQTTNYFIQDIPIFRVILLDPKTNIALWVQDEYVEGKPSLGQFTKKNRDIYVHALIDKFVADLKEISGPPTAAR